MFLSDLAVKRSVLTTVIILIFGILGLVGYLGLPVNLFPDIEFPFVSVTAVYQGAGPREIETLISKPLEDELSTIANLKSITSISQEGVALVLLEFELGTDVDVAAADTRDKVALVEPRLPRDAERPLISKFDIGAQPILSLAVTGDRTPPELFQIADTRIKSEFAKIPGVAAAEIVGGQEREIRVALRKRRLDAYRISPDDVIRAVAAANLDVPSGRIVQDRTEVIVRLAGKLGAVELIEDIRIAAPDGRLVRIGDLAEVSDTVKEVRELARFQGSPSLGMTIRKRADANTIEIARRVRSVIAELEGRLPPDIRIEVAQDSSVFIAGSISEVWNNIAIGILLTALCLFLFLHDLRSTLIVALAMPTSIVSTFLLLYLAGYSVNIMTMLGLALSVGILVNNSILVLENIYRYIQIGNDSATAARKGPSAIAAAVASTTLTNIVVFVPIAFMSSIVGQFFRQFAMTVVFATIFSLFISYTLTPMLGFKLLKNADALRNKRKIFRAWDDFYISLSHSYGDFVRRLIRWKWLVVTGAVALFAASLLLLPLIGGEFFPQTDQGAFRVTVETPVGSTLAVTDSVVRKVEDLIERLPERERVFVTVGRVSGLMGGSNTGVNLAEINVELAELKARERSTREVINALRPGLAAIPGAVFTLVETQQAGGGGGEAPIQVEISGEEIDVLNDLADEVIALARNIPAAVDVQKDWRLGLPEIWVIPDRARAERHGIPVATIANTLRAALTGEVASTFRDADDEFDIRVQFDDADRALREQISGIKIPDRQGNLIPLPALAGIEQRLGPTVISRKDRQRLVTVSANVLREVTSVGDVYQDLDRNIREKVSFPSGYAHRFGGEVEMMQEEFREIFLALGLATLLTFLLLAGILESYRFPVMIMLSLPLSMICVLLILFITGTTSNIFSLMAVVTLVGLVINNAIVVVDYANQLVRAGTAVEDALVTSCVIRLRPLLMANLTTVVAWTPLALGMGMGGGFRAPMAIVSIGGMIGGGFLTLFVIPPLYMIFSGRKSRA